MLLSKKKAGMGGTSSVCSAWKLCPGGLALQGQTVSPMEAAPLGVNIPLGQVRDVCWSVTI